MPGVRIVAPYPLGILGLAQICSRRFQDGIALLEGCLTSARLSGVGMVFCWQQPQTKACWIVLGLITPWHCYSFADNNPDLFMNWRALSWGYWKSWGIFLGDSGDWNIGASNFPLNLAKLAEYNPFDPTQSPSSCWHNYSTNSACVCVSHLIPCLASSTGQIGFTNYLKPVSLLRVSLGLHQFMENGQTLNMIKSSQSLIILQGVMITSSCLMTLTLFCTSIKYVRTT